MNKENCALKLVDEIILYYDARSKTHKQSGYMQLQLRVSNNTTLVITWFHKFLQLI